MSTRVNWLFVQYFRQCIQHPPPNVTAQSQQRRPWQPAGSPPPLGDSHPSTPTSNQARCYASRRTRSNAQPSSAKSLTPDARRLLSVGPVQCGKVETGPAPTRNFSEPLDEGEPSPVQRSADDSHENGRAVDHAVSSGLMHSRKIVESAEELASLGDGKDEHGEELAMTDADLVDDCAWTAPHDGSLDSGCMSDLSSDSPSITVSPHQSLINDDDCAATRRLEELEPDHGRVTEMAGGVPATPLAAAAASVSVQSGPSSAQSLPRYVRPMREIPPRFRRLLAAEAERVVRLCQRLNGSPLHAASTPTDAANDRRGSSTDVSRHTQASYVDKAQVAGQASYSAQSSVVYVTAHSSGLPVYPPAASERVAGCPNEVEAPSYVIPVAVGGDPSLHSGGLPPAAVDGLPPAVPMLLQPNPLFYYHGPALPPPPDVGPAYSYVVPTPVVGGCPQPGPVETGRPPVKNTGQTTEFAPDVGVFHSTTDDAYSSSSCYYDSPPGPPQLLQPFCSLQLA